MKAGRRTYLIARAALRVGGEVVLSLDHAVFVSRTFVGRVNRGQADKLRARGAKTEQGFHQKGSS